MISLVYRRNRTSIDVLELDACESQQHTVSLDVTKHPIEDGADVTDHSRRQPDEVTIVGVVSNAPVGGVSLSADVVTQTAADGGSFDLSGNPEISAALAKNDARANSAFATLLRLADKRAIVVVTTSLRTYRSMLLDRIDVPVNQRTGSSLRFSAHFVQANFVSSEVVRVSLPKAKAKKREGKKPTKSPGAAEPPARSLLLKLKQTVSGWFN